MSNIGSNIKRLRKNFNMSQEEFGEILEKRKSTISQYESGKRDPDEGTLQKISEYFGYPMDILVSGEVSDLDCTKMVFSRDLLLEMWDVSLYFIKPAEEDDEDFKKGYRRTISINANIKRGIGIHASYVEETIKIYKKSEANGNIKAVANITGLLVLFLISVKGIEYKKIEEEITNKPILPKKFLSLIYESKTDKSYRQDVDTSDILSLFDKYLEKMKKSEYSDLADFYIALSYLLKIVECEYNDNISEIIGSELMWKFMSLGNDYAYFYLVKIFEPNP